MGKVVEKSWNGIGKDNFTDVMLRSSINCHQEHALPTATEPHWQYNDITTAGGTLFYVSMEFPVCKHY